MDSTYVPTGGFSGMEHSVYSVINNINHRSGAGQAQNESAMKKSACSKEVSRTLSRKRLWRQQREFMGRFK